MTQEKKAKVQEMFSVAETFKESAELLPAMNEVLKVLAQKQGKTLPNGKPLQFDSVILTKIVLYGLIVEINMKTICKAYDIDYGHEHDHVSLFREMPQSIQEEIKNSINENFKQNFDELLENNKKTFVEWRYCYEYQSIHCDVSFLQDLANVTGSIALRLSR